MKAKSGLWVAVTRERRRGLMLLRSGLIALAASFALSAAAAPPAQAWYETYCYLTVVGPLPLHCASSGLHSLRYNEVMTTSSSQAVCQWMWNAHNQKIRGDYVNCEWLEARRTWGPTSDAWYNAKGHNWHDDRNILISARTWTD